MKAFQFSIFCFFILTSSTGFAQFLIKGSVYDQLHNLRNNASIYLYVQDNNNIEVIDSVKTNPFTFTVKDTTRQYLIGVKTQDADLNFLVNNYYAYNLIVGVKFAKMIGPRLMFDFDNTYSINTLDKLRFLYLLNKDCNEIDLNNNPHYLFKIDAADLDPIDGEKMPKKAQEISATKSDKQHINKFENGVSNTTLMAGQLGRIVDFEEPYVFEDSSRVLNVEVDDVLLTSNKEVTVEIGVRAPGLLKAFILPITFSNVTNLKILDSPNSRILGFAYGNKLLVYSELPISPLEKIKVNFTPLTSGEISQIVSFEPCGNIEAASLWDIKEQLYYSKTINLQYKPILGCESYWPSDTTLTHCLSLDNYRPFQNSECANYYTYRFIDVFDFDQFGKCILSNRTWYRTSDDGTVSTHYQKIYFSNAMEAFCKPFADISLINGEGTLPLEKIIFDSLDIRNYSFDLKNFLDTLPISSINNASKSILTYNLKTSKFCITDLHVKSCEEGSLLKYKERDYLNFGESTLGQINALSFDLGSYNYCDPIKSMMISTDGLNYYFSIQINPKTIQSPLKLKLRYEYQSGRRLEVEVIAIISNNPIKKIEFSAYDDYLIAGQTYKIEIRSKDFVNFIGLQCQLLVKNAAFVQFIPGAFSLNETAYNYIFSIQTLRMVWMSIGISPRDYSNQVLFSIEVTPYRDASVSEIISIGYTDFDSFVIDKDFDNYNIDFSFEFPKRISNTVLNEQMKGLKLESNPSCCGMINVMYEGAGNFEFFAYVYDSTGKLLSNMEHKIGGREIKTLLMDVRPGVYFLRLVQGNIQNVQKVIVL